MSSNDIRKYIDILCENTLKELRDTGINPSWGGGDGEEDLWDILMSYIRSHAHDLFDRWGEDTVGDVISNMITMGDFQDINVDDPDWLDDAVIDVETALEKSQDEDEYEDEDDN